jgi:hypothetical protein
MKPSFMLVLDKSRWRLARLTGQQVELRDVPAGENGDAAQVKPALVEWGYADEGVCLALPSALVLSAQIDCQGLPRGHRRSAMTFRMEEQLPLDVEKLTVDFLPQVGGRAMGVSVESGKIKEQLDALTAVGIEAVAICPLALLAAWGQCQEAPAPDYVIVVEAPEVEVFRLEGGVPVSWFTVPDDGLELVECIRADQLAHPARAQPPTVCVIAEPAWSGGDLEARLGLKILRRREESPVAAAAENAGKIHAGVPAGWVNLRQDALAVSEPWRPVRSLLRTTVALGLVLPVLVAAAFFWRGMQYSSAAEEVGRQQAAIYRTLYPQRTIPADVKRELGRDLKRLSGISGAAQDLPPRVNALETLRMVTAGLPPEIRLRILDMQLDATRVYIKGQTLSHTDAEVINQGLVAQGFVMEAPKTEVLLGTEVTFTLAGTPPGPGSAPAAKPAAEALPVDEAPGPTTAPATMAPAETPATNPPAGAIPAEGATP